MTDHRDIRDALDHVVPHYQPIVDLNTGEVIGAEGVETREQAFFLRAAGADAGQGWLWSKAIPENALEQVVKDGFPQQQTWLTPGPPGAP